MFNDKPYPNSKFKFLFETLNGKLIFIPLREYEYTRTKIRF